MTRARRRQHFAYCIHDLSRAQMRAWLEEAGLAAARCGGADGVLLSPDAAAEARAPADRARTGLAAASLKVIA